jgi:hypothetical protein
MDHSHEVVSSAVSGHAGKVDGLAEDVRAALDAVSAVSAAPGTYGTTCEDFTALLGDLAESGTATLTAAVATAELAAKNLRTAVARYAAVDESGSATVRST